MSLLINIKTTDLFTTIYVNHGTNWKLTLKTFTFKNNDKQRTKLASFILFYQFILYIVLSYHL